MRLPTQPGTHHGTCPTCTCGTGPKNPSPSVEVSPPWPQLLSAKQVTAITSLSRSTIDRREAEGNFPRRVRIGPGMKKWRLPEILDWIANPHGPRAIPTTQRDSQPL